MTQDKLTTLGQTGLTLPVKPSEIQNPNTAEDTELDKYINASDNKDNPQYDRERNREHEHNREYTANYSLNDQHIKQKLINLFINCIYK